MRQWIYHCPTTFSQIKRNNYLKISIYCVLPYIVETMSLQPFVFIIFVFNVQKICKSDFFSIKTVIFSQFSPQSNSEVGGQGLNPFRECPFREDADLKCLSCLWLSSKDSVKNWGGAIENKSSRQKYFWPKTRFGINRLNLFLKNKLECLSRKSFSDRANVCVRDL